VLIDLRLGQETGHGGIVGAEVWVTGAVASSFTKDSSVGSSGWRSWAVEGGWRLGLSPRSRRIGGLL
jgi:hypothetical protein